MHRFPGQRTTPPASFHPHLHPLRQVNSKNASRISYISTSKASSSQSNSGISLERRVRISMDRLYGETAFQQAKNEQSTKCASSTSLFSKRFSFKTERSSKRTTSFLQGSDYAFKTTQGGRQAKAKPKAAVRQEQIFNAYYSPDDQFKPKGVSVRAHLVGSPGRAIVDRRYDVNRVIRY